MDVPYSKTEQCTYFNSVFPIFYMFKMVSHPCFMSNGTVGYFMTLNDRKPTVAYKLPRSTIYQKLIVSLGTVPVTVLGRILL